MKKIISYSFSFLLFVLVQLCCMSCSDYFNPTTDDELENDHYISSKTEMYTGFLGIMTRLQAIGDKEILLTETRSEAIEPTDDSSSELIALHNYNDDLSGNSYANPAGYYDVIIACNDYMNKMYEYKTRYTDAVEDTVYSALVSSALRIKAWTYKTLNEIYGEAYWFDGAVTKVENIKDSLKYQHLYGEEIIDKCLQLMDNGFQGVNSKEVINWIKWLDPDNENNIANSSYRKWNWMIPPYEGVYAELCLWKGAYLDAKGIDAKAYYKTASDELLSAINVYMCNSSYVTSGYFCPGAPTPGHYASFWDYAQPYQAECAAALIYDYTNNQTNTLLHHFSNEYPNKYLLRPTQAARDRFSGETTNPGSSEGTTDKRFSVCIKQNDGSYYVSKFRPVGSSVRTNAYQDDVHIYLYRATQYHLMLSEALNHQKRYTAADAVLNQGVANAFILDTKADSVQWEGFNQDWTSSASWGTRKYPNTGIRGCQGLSSRNFLTNDYDGRDLPGGTLRNNDEAIADEYMLEMYCEGKAYPALIRNAIRYNDPDFVANRVVGKYSASLQATIKAKIEQGAYFVPWEM